LQGDAHFFNTDAVLDFSASGESGWDEEGHGCEILGSLHGEWLVVFGVCLRLERRGRRR